VLKTEACVGDAETTAGPLSDADATAQGSAPSPTLVLVNVSPIEQCHFLLVPSATAGLPQRLTRMSLWVTPRASLHGTCRFGWHGACHVPCCRHRCRVAFACCLPRAIQPYCLLVVYHVDVLRVALELLATAQIARRLLKGRTYCVAQDAAILPHFVPSCIGTSAAMRTCRRYCARYAT
jgi:hypothetical protein